LQVEVRHIRDELHSLRDDNRRLAHNNKLLIERMDNDWNQTNGCVNGDDINRTGAGIINFLFVKLSMLTGRLEAERSVPTRSGNLGIFLNQDDVNVTR
jgi:hypothetical protein